MSENSYSRDLTPVHLCYFSSNGFQIVQFDVNWGLWPESYKNRPSDPFHCLGTNNIRVTPHTLLSKSEMMHEQSDGVCSRPRSFLMAMLRIPLRREGRGPILLRWYTVYQSLCKQLRSFSGHKIVYQSKWCFLEQRGGDTPGPLSMIPISFSCNLHGCLLVTLCFSTTSCLLEVALPGLHQIHPPPLFHTRAPCLCIHIMYHNVQLFTGLLPVYYLSISSMRLLQVQLPYSSLGFSYLGLVECLTLSFYLPIFLKISKKNQINLGNSSLTKDEQVSCLQESSEPQNTNTDVCPQEADKYNRQYFSNLFGHKKNLIFHGILLSLEHLVQLISQRTLFRKHCFQCYQYERYFRADAQNTVPDTPRRHRAGFSLSTTRHHGKHLPSNMQAAVLKRLSFPTYQQTKNIFFKFQRKIKKDKYFPIL